MLLYQQGDLEAAITDLTAALEIGDDAALRANRAVAYSDAGRWAEAEAGYAVALALDPDDESRLQLAKLGR